MSELHAQDGLTAAGGDASGDGGSVAYSVGQVFGQASAATHMMSEGVQHTYFISLLVTVCLTGSLWAQVPQKMNYQAIIRNENDSLVRTQQVGLRLSILQGDVAGHVVYMIRLRLQM